MPEDTQIGGTNSRFPLTRWSAIVASGSANSAERQRGFEILLEGYWKPVYKYVRIKWRKSNEDAKDLTQAFFATAIEKEFFRGFDPARARFRTFLRTCLDGFVANEEKAAHRLKRGGQQKILSLDFESADQELAFADIPDSQNHDDFFDREWMRHLFATCVRELQVYCQNSGKAIQFEIFQRYDLNENDSTDKATYNQLASEFQLPVTQVTNYLAFARKEFRRIVLEKLRELTVTEEEFQSEARALFGIEK
jgi:RNA polymerase sigma factor (sigma-70 family)